MREGGSYLILPPKAGEVFTLDRLSLWVDKSKTRGVSSHTIGTMRPYLLLGLLCLDGGHGLWVGSHHMVPRGVRASTPRCCSDSTDAALLVSLQKVSARQGEVIVIKFGGHAMTNDERAADFASDITLLQGLGLRPVVVHGGGPQIGEMLSRMEIKSNFVECALTWIRIRAPITLTNLRVCY
jgi:hypothetical protein